MTTSQRLESLVSDQISAVSSQPAVVQKLLLAKINYNINILRQTGSPSATILGFEGRVMDVEHRLYKQAKQAEQQQLKPLTSQQEENVLDELNELPSTAPPQLRKLRNRKTKLEINEEIQTDLSDDLLQMVQKIRENAEKFNEKLDADRSVVDSAASALQNASSSMGLVGTKLQNYRKSNALGWWFYIYATLFIVSCVIFGMVLIQLFPKF